MNDTGTYGLGTGMQGGKFLLNLQMIFKKIMNRILSFSCQVAVMNSLSTILLNILKHCFAYRYRYQIFAYIIEQFKTSPFS
jgi:hypothetical protein